MVASSAAVCYEPIIDRPLTSFALLLALVAPPACVDLPNPTCATDDDCLALGWCSCREGLCFKLGCPPLTEDTVQIDVADTAADPCVGAVLSSTPDGCCPEDPIDRSGDPDCTKASGTYSAEAPVLSPAAAGDGRVFLVVKDGGSLWLRGLDATLGASGQIALSDGAALPPTVLPNGDVAVVSGDSILLAAKGAVTAAAKSSVHTGHGPLVSAVTSRPGGGLLSVTLKGAIVELDTTSGDVQASKDGVVASGNLAQTALWTGAEEQVYWVAIAGVLHGVRLDSLSTPWTVDGATSAPALASDGAVVVATQGGVTGLGADHMTALATYKAGGADLLDPVIGPGDVVVVASPKQKRVTAIRFLPSGAYVRWTAVLQEAPATPPLVLAGGDVVLGLADGSLVGLRAAGATAAVAWRYAGTGHAVSAPLDWADGTVLHLTDKGTLRRLVAGPGGDAGPWPRVRRNERNSGALPAE